MEKILIFTIGITVLYCVFKFIEMKYIEKEIKPLKLFVRDVIMVFSSSFISCYILLNYDKNITDLFAVVTDTKIFQPENTMIFTGAPEF
jgi:multisubunit Na+/H+ antiporter MnhB subunit